MEKYAVIGLGKFGSSIARKLSKRGAEVIALDNREANIESLQDEVAHAILMDATDKKALEAHNLQDVEAAVVAIGENFEALLLCTAYLQELNVKRVIVRANGPQQRKILEKMGVTEILSPEDEVGRAVAEQLINPSVLSVLELPDNYEIAEIRAPRKIVNRTIEKIGLRIKYNLNLVTIKREYQEMVRGESVIGQHIIGVPTSETVIYDTDTIIVFGTNSDIERFIQVNQ